ncbi:MAG: transposase family protein [Kineosporiaceae bacterium]|nr:transposase family protein [Aeromicrobium sp.]
MTTFCVEHGISRKAFYAIKRRAAEEGQAAALAPRTRRPANSPGRLADEVKQQAIGVRAALEQSGLDHGPISVHEKMRSLGMTPVPSTASLSRIFRDAGVARAEPRKKPRALFRRFVYPAPNACWQLDGTEYVLTGGRKCVIFQLIDDHARYAVASHVAWGETSEAAIAVVKKVITAHGVPQRLLSDNGAALNPSRRGVVGQLVTYLEALGVEAITGKPYKPTTQGKNERFHQTLFRFLDKQPLAGSLEELQEQVDRFDQIHNTERPHQGLPGKITPQQAWEATPKADPPRPRNTQRPVGWDGIRQTRVALNGIVQVRQTRFHVTRKMAGQTVFLIEADQHLLVFDDRGTEAPRHRDHEASLAQTRSQVRQLRPTPRTATQNHLSVTDVLMQEVLPMS